jgi:GNAT superfamily N-acetyltransferase
MTAAVRVRAAGPGEGLAVAQVISDAFHDLGMSHYLVPDPEQRREIFPPHFQIFVDHALEHGTVHVVDGYDAVAVWFPPTGVPEIADYDKRLLAACGDTTPRFEELDAAMQAAHPHEPHEHLAFLAVRPELQGKGLGTLLMQQRHRELDERGEPAYLEASSPRSRELYLRHGYRPVGEPFSLAEGATMWPMARAPRT